VGRGTPNVEMLRRENPRTARARAISLQLRINSGGI